MFGDSWQCRYCGEKLVARANIKELFQSKIFKRRKYFNQDVILNTYSQYLGEKMSWLDDHYYGNLLWRIINLELWLETFTIQDKINNCAHSEN